MLCTAFSEIFPADCFVAGFSVFTAKPAALITEKFHFLFLLSVQLIEQFLLFIQPEIRHHIAKRFSVQFLLKLPEICQDLRRGRNKIKTRKSLFQIRQQPIRRNDHSVL